MKQTILFILTIILFYGCERVKNSESAKGEYITVNAKKISLNNDSQLLLSDFIDKIDIIPLEFEDNCILSEIKKIVIYRDNIFLIEEGHPETIFRFNIQGNFLNRIGSRGQGPQELIELSDFSLNEDDQIVYLLDNAKQMIFCFDFDGKYIGRIHINQYADRLEYQNGLFYLFRDNPSVGDNLYNLIIRNIKGEIEKVYFPSKKYSISFNNKIFTKTKDNLIFLHPMNDTIYSLDGASLNYAYFFDFGSNRFTQNEIEDIYMGRIKSLQILLNNERLSGIDNFFQVGKHMYFNSIYKTFSFSFLYDINSQKLKVAALLWDDLEYIFYNNKFCGQTQDAFIGTYNVNYLINDIERFARYEKEKYISSEKKEEQVKKMKAIMRGNDPEEMNPWVIIYHLKKD